ncbi:hypothetical protein SAMN04488063_0022 [Halopelagius inordinatus]|uniref:SWIM-type domain-containing protein n=1 Tax=Halopelagius inordinatus TaxID=553467 RepID=A0A1I2WXJ5_9EURY|nr:hypothetical protein [Halopelagius inordinatus]SFH05349.1 hypothetical protein SAMN04488063_0022 [Halopelagius inordinatus]
MCTIESAEVQGIALETDPDARDVRAVTQYLTVLDDAPGVAGADDMYLVVSESGSDYTVDARSGACPCPDSTYNLDDGELCKHARRVAIVRGERAFPAVPVDDVDEQIGIHVPNGVTLADVTASADTLRPLVADGGEIIVAGDDGEILDDDGPTYTFHRETPDVGGARYVRCEECGAECVPADPDRLLHRAGCSGRD